MRCRANGHANTTLTIGEPALLDACGGKILNRSGCFFSGDGVFVSLTLWKVRLQWTCDFTVVEIAEGRRDFGFGLLGFC